MHQAHLGQMIRQSFLKLQQTAGVVGHHQFCSAGGYGLQLALEHPVGHHRLSEVVVTTAAAAGIGIGQFAKLTFS